VYSLAILGVENYNIDVLSYFGKTINPATVLILQKIAYQIIRSILIKFSSIYTCIHVYRNFYGYFNIPYNLKYVIIGAISLKYTQFI